MASRAPSWPRFRTAEPSRRSGRALLVGVLLCLLLSLHLVLEHAVLSANVEGPPTPAAASTAQMTADPSPAVGAVAGDVPASPQNGHLLAAVCTLLLLIGMTVVAVLKRARAGQSAPPRGLASGGVMRRGPPAPPRALLCIDRV